MVASLRVAEGLRRGRTHVSVFFCMTVIGQKTNTIYEIKRCTINLPLIYNLVSLLPQQGKVYVNNWNLALRCEANFFEILN